ncbi:MAG: leucine-rich repeat domain-containing protein [Eubacteriales bacterium]|nr:leucine-rich repeat domain-containing protein [Eubacteriales bacterium]
MKKKLITKYKISAAIIMGAFLAAVMFFSSCGKKTQIQVFTYEENADGTLSITGLTQKGSTDSRLDIPSEIDGRKVCGISREAFRDNTCVTEIIISDGITRIAENAFLNCTNLSKISFPDGLLEIGTNVVKNTEWEKEQLLEHSEIIVGNILVEAGDIGSSYKVPDGVKHIASGAFYCNEAVKEVTFPDGLESIGSYAFAGCKNITDLTVPDSVLKVGYDAFLDIGHVSYQGKAGGSPWGAGAVN